jgi:hypothetical protein
MKTHGNHEMVLNGPADVPDVTRDREIYVWSQHRQGLVAITNKFFPKHKYRRVMPAKSIPGWSVEDWEAFAWLLNHGVGEEFDGGSNGKV